MEYHKPYNPDFYISIKIKYNLLIKIFNEYRPGLDLTCLSQCVFKDRFRFGQVEKDSSNFIAFEHYNDKDQLFDHFSISVQIKELNIAELKSIIRTVRSDQYGSAILKAVKKENAWCLCLSFLERKILQRQLEEIDVSDDEKFENFIRDVEFVYRKKATARKLKEVIIFLRRLKLNMQ